ncbi:unnamed protein product, partial [Discosporangium mesarthrocarpum]
GRSSTGEGAVLLMWTVSPSAHDRDVNSALCVAGLLHGYFLFSVCLFLCNLVYAFFCVLLCNSRNGIFLGLLWAAPKGSGLEKCQLCLGPGAPRRQVLVNPKRLLSG